MRKKIIREIPANFESIDHDKLTRRQKVWLSNGMYFGFPPCCIFSFMFVKVKNRTKNQNKVHKFFGFIPCSECSDRIVNGEIKLEDLISKKLRQCEFTFPRQD